MSEASDERGTRWVVRFAFVLWLVSFFLPAARLGAPSGRAAIGLLAALYAGAVLPAALLRLATGPPAPLDEAYALLAGLFFLVLLLQNFLMLYVAVRPRAGRLVRRLAALAALLVWGAVGVSYARLYRTLGLEIPRFRLEPGYYLWALSFVCLAAALWRGRGAEPPRRP